MNTAGGGRTTGGCCRMRPWEDWLVGCPGDKLLMWIERKLNPFFCLTHPRWKRICPRVTPPPETYIHTPTPPPHISTLIRVLRICSRRFIERLFSMRGVHAEFLENSPPTSTLQNKAFYDDFGWVNWLTSWSDCAEFMTLCFGRNVSCMIKWNLSYGSCNEMRD
jgi:hypothetical protein